MNREHQTAGMTHSARSAARWSPGWYAPVPWRSLGATIFEALMHTFLSMLGVATAALGCFPSFDLGRGGAGGTASSTGTGTAHDLGSDGGRPPRAAREAEAAARARPSAWSPTSLGVFHSQVEVTGIVAAGGKLFVAGHTDADFQVGGGTFPAGTFLFWGPEASQLNLQVIALDPEMGVNPPQVELGSSTRNGTTYLELARGTGNAIELWELDAAAFDGTLTPSSAGPSCTAPNPLALQNPSIATRPDGTVVLALQITTAYMDLIACNFGSVQVAQSDLPSNSLTMSLLLGVQGQFMPPFVAVSNTSQYESVPRLALLPGPLTGPSVVLATRSGTDAGIVHSVRTFEWAQKDSAAAILKGQYLNPWSDVRAAAVASDAFVGGGVFDGVTTTYRSFVESGSGTALLDEMGFMLDTVRVRDLHGGGARLAVGGTTTLAPGLAVAGGTENPLVCKTTEPCGFVATLDPKSSALSVAEATIEPASAPLEDIATTAVFSDACGRTYAAGSFSGSAQVHFGTSQTVDISSVDRSIFVLALGKAVR